MSNICTICPTRYGCGFFLGTSQRACAEFALVSAKITGSQIEYGHGGILKLTDLER